RPGVLDDEFHLRDRSGRDLFRSGDARQATPRMTRSRHRTEPRACKATGLDLSIANTKESWQARYPCLVGSRHILPAISFDCRHTRHMGGQARRVNERSSRTGEVLYAKEKTVFLCRCRQE